MRGQKAHSLILQQQRGARQFFVGQFRVIGQDDGLRPFFLLFQFGHALAQVGNEIPVADHIRRMDAFCLQKGHQGRHRREQLLPAGGDAHAVQLFYVGFRRLGGVVAQKEKIHILPVPLHKGHGPLDGIVPHIDGTIHVQNDATLVRKPHAVSPKFQK